MAKQLEKKHTLAVRWLHWINFPLLFVMIWSGLLIYWANAVYGFWIGPYEVFHFFPAPFYDFFGIPYRLAEGMRIHFFFMWLFTANGLAYVVYLIASGEWRSILPVPSSLKRAFRVALYDAHIVKSKPPQGKYNDAQRIAYTTVILMGAGSVITGLAIYKPLQLAWLTTLLSGYEWARWMHFWLTILFVLFFVVHVVQVVIAGWRNFQSMITGRELSTKNYQLETVEADKTQRGNTAAILNEKRRLSEPLPNEEARRLMWKYSRRGFIVGGAAGLAGFFGWRFLSDETKSRLYESAFRFNERVSQVFYRPTRLAPEFPPTAISPARVNGYLGIESEIDLSAWTLAVGGLANRTDDLILNLDDIKRLPRVEMITELKCIEGWTVIVQWAGARFSDFVAAYPPAGTPPYVSISTPDNQYFVGWDMPSIMHPQTLLAYEMNGEPLKPEHGAPLRLASPTKYGIKLIKRIGRIEFTSTRPRDYWAEEGYDWYSGH